MAAEGTAQPGRRLRTAREVIFATYVGLLTAALLGRASLLDTIARSEHGPLRAQVMALLAPVATAPAPAPPAPPPAPVRVPELDAVSAPLPEAEAPAPPWWRAISAEAPLRVWVAGDSLLNMAAPELERRLEATGRATVRTESRSSTGLVRPDYFDWSRRVAQVLSQVSGRPEAVVLMIGANDSQHMLEGGRRLDRNSPAWVAAYARRVEAIMAQAEAAGVRLYWVGLPTMRLERRQETAQLINPQLAAAAATRRCVRYVSTWEAFGDEAGGYRWWGLDRSGQRVAMRDADGAHFTLAGAAHLADLIAAVVDGEWGLTQATPTQETWIGADGEALGSARQAR